MAPHLFWRTGDPQLPDDDFSQVRPHVGAMTAETILADVDAALAYIEGAGFPPEAAGIVGFCAGGTIALGVAANRQIGAAVTYYGGGILEGRFGFPPMIEMAPGLTVPWLGLFGGQDQSIPGDQVDRLAEAAAEAEVRPRSSGTRTPATPSTGTAAPPTTRPRPPTPGTARSSGSPTT